MKYFGRNLRQRLEDEAPLVQRGMRDSEVRGVDDPGIKQQNVDINGPWSFFLDAPPAHLLFDAKNRGDQFLRSLAGFKRERTIEKPRLLSELHRLGLINRRRRNHTTDYAQPSPRIPQLPLAVADI